MDFGNAKIEFCIEPNVWKIEISLIRVDVAVASGLMLLFKKKKRKKILGGTPH